MTTHSLRVMGEQVELNCLVYGEVPASRYIFMVSVSPDKRINHLKREIRECEPSMPSAREMVLYIPKETITTCPADEFNNAIGRIEFDADLQELSPTEQISNYESLSSPSLDELHIIVVLLSEYRTSRLK